MSLHDGISATLPRLREHAASLMVDEGKALRPTGGYEYVDGIEVLATDPLFGPIQCKIKPPRSVAPRDVEVGGRTAVVIPGELHLPADPSRPEFSELTIGDIWEITSTDDNSLTQLGRRYRITAEADGSMVTACRYTIERVVS